MNLPCDTVVCCGWDLGALMGFVLRHFFSAGQPSPSTIEQLVAALHQGAIAVCESTPESTAYVAFVRESIAKTQGDDFLARALQGPCPLLPYPDVVRTRDYLYHHPTLRHSAAKMLRSLGFWQELRCDTPKLRVIGYGVEKIPEAAPVYLAHRDTWYACPQDQINIWVPVFDTPVEQALAFHPSYLTKPVKNSSHYFDYETWISNVGWHGPGKPEDYPGPTEEIVAENLRFALSAGEILLFSGVHIHQALPNPIKGSARWSLDVRLSGFANGVSNVDNASRGFEARLLREYLPLSSL